MNPGNDGLRGEEKNKRLKENRNEMNKGMKKEIGKKNMYFQINLLKCTYKQILDNTRFKSVFFLNYEN